MPVGFQIGCWQPYSSPPERQVTEERLRSATRLPECLQSGDDILLDQNGQPLTTAPDFSAYAINDYLPVK